MQVKSLRKCEYKLKIFKILIDIMASIIWTKASKNSPSLTTIFLIPMFGVVTGNYSLYQGILRVKEWSNFLKLIFLQGAVLLIFLHEPVYSIVVFAVLFLLGRVSFLKIEDWYRKKTNCYRFFKIYGEEKVKNEIVKKINKFPELYIKLTDNANCNCEGIIKDINSFIDVLGNSPLFRSEKAKRICDLLISILLTISLFPLFIFIGILIKLDSPGPVLFVQTRIGKKGKPFRMYKFRSMFTNTPKYTFSPVKLNDSRITKVGRWLRKTGFDEFPQLLNVIKGDMSLVGPRPEMPFIVKNYTELEKKRLEILPGITGLWQISRDRRELIHKNIEYDLYYIKHRDLFLDMVIILKTVLITIFGRGKEQS